MPVEYLVQEINTSLTPAELAAALNTLGKDDWELVFQFPTSLHPMGVFMRRVGEHPAHHGKRSSGSAKHR